MAKTYTRAKSAPNKLSIYGEIEIGAKAQAKIDNWVKMCPKEISGLGTVLKTDGGFYIDEVYLLDQEVSASETELDPAAIARLQGSLPPEDAERLRFWWHSHVNMPVFWSGTDEQAIEQLSQDGFFIHIVYNKKGEKLARLEVRDPFSISLDNVSVTVDTQAAALKHDLAQTYAEFLEESPDEAVSLLHQFHSEADDIERNALGAYRAEYKEFCEKEYKEKVKTRYPVATGYYSRPAYTNRGKIVVGEKKSPKKNNVVAYEEWSDEEAYGWLEHLGMTEKDISNMTEKEWMEFYNG